MVDGHYQIKYARASDIAAKHNQNGNMIRSYYVIYYGYHITTIICYSGMTFYESCHVIT